MTLLLLNLDNSIVCFHYHLHFLRYLQRSQAQQNILHLLKTKLFAEQKNAQQR